KLELTLGRTEQILDLLVDSPACAKLDLMRALGDGNVVAELIVVRLVDPRPTGYFKLRAGGALQVDIRDAVQVVGTAKEPRVSGVVPRRKGQTAQAGARERNNVDAVAVIVERRFVQQVRADRVGRVNDRAVRRIAEGVANRRHVRAAPLADCETLA